MKIKQETLNPKIPKPKLEGLGVEKLEGLEVDNFC